MGDPVDEVLAAERRLLDPAVRADATALDALLDAEFTEVGASGRLWSRDETIAALTDLPAVDATVTDLRGRQVAPDVAVVTYTTRAADRVVWRSSWWRRDDSGTWRCVFHQGTPAARP